jgi:hypothetical protein
MAGWSRVESNLDVGFPFVVTSPLDLRTQSDGFLLNCVPPFLAPLYIADAAGIECFEHASRWFVSRPGLSGGTDSTYCL